VQNDGEVLSRQIRAAKRGQEYEADREESAA